MQGVKFLDDLKFQQAPVVQGQTNGNHKGRRTTHFIEKLNQTPAAFHVVVM